MNQKFHTKQQYIKKIRQIDEERNKLTENFSQTQPQ